MLFNKNGNGSVELKKLLGFIYASIEFENLETYIDIAQNDLIEDVIGQEIYDVAQAHYDSPDYEHDDSGSGSGDDRTSEDLTNLVHKLQLPIALMAYRNYANSADLTHSNKGRQIFVSENEKPAFEWMVKRDEENILNTAFRSTDLALKFLEDNIDLFPEYANSDAYAKQKGHFINTAKDFDSIFPIEKSRRLFVVLIPFINEIERKTLKAILGKDLYDELKAYITGDDSGSDLEELLDYVQPALALLTMAMAVRRLPVRVLPSGIFQSYVPETVSLSPKKAADKDVRELFGALLERDGQVEIQKLQEYLLKKDTEAGGETYTPVDPTARHSENNSFFRA
jgi:hypothetical protein